MSIMGWKWSAGVDFIHVGPDGAVIWRHTGENNLANEGEFMVLDSFLRNQGHPPSFMLRMFNDVPVDTDSLASLTGEPGGGSGYLAQSVLRSATAAGWPTLVQDAGDWMAISRQVTFDCISPYTVQYVVLATTSDNSGRLISYAALSQSRTLASGEQLRVTFRPRLS